MPCRTWNNSFVVSLPYPYSKNDRWPFGAICHFYMLFSAAQEQEEQCPRPGKPGRNHGGKGLLHGGELPGAQAAQLLIDAAHRLGIPQGHHSPA